LGSSNQGWDWRYISVSYFALIFFCAVWGDFAAFRRIKEIEWLLHGEVRGFRMMVGLLITQLSVKKIEIPYLSTG
jgi:hypothetical protein